MPTTLSDTVVGIVEIRSWIVGWHTDSELLAFTICGGQVIPVAGPRSFQSNLKVGTNVSLVSGV
jgi:hypothetical protein